MLISVTWAVGGRDGSPSALSTRITRPPVLSGTKSSKTERSKQMDVEASVPDNSSAVKIRAQLIKLTVLRCSMATPLGLPVDPDV